jgi:SAM-dependent methyltransferase
VTSDQRIAFAKVLNFLRPSTRYKSHYLNQHHLKVATGVYQHNIGRVLVLAEFIHNINGKLPTNRPIKVAVVGGYRNEPEILVLEKLGYQTFVTIFGVEDSDVNLDLNSQENSLGNFDMTFDLILCSQVFEHIWNHQQALRNIQRLMGEGSLIWLAAPASNHAHGVPRYYSAGFTAEYLLHNLGEIGMAGVAWGNIGSPRNYRAIHTIPNWLNLKGHQFPITHGFSNYPFLINLAYSIRYFHNLIALSLISPKVTSDVSVATECWVLAKQK